MCALMWRFCWTLMCLPVVIAMRIIRRVLGMEIPEIRVRAQDGRWAGGGRNTTMGLHSKDMNEDARRNQDRDERNGEDVPRRGT
ncbi:hypothetical protein AMATHDRAFT_69288 [Amanita thiersii Skay4041]|uniref:Secreted protein n=1 Tax=Amanita thiersii Skay4041 TaxID=703135 RepID=A0A2A9NEJ9_9AGAR|nr:hypothetical protein AMATHDRAFT_69288 [Amanita thiersii Skay4041]